MAAERNKRKPNVKPREKQPRKDSRDKRVNYDNTRVQKFDKDVERMRQSSGYTSDKSNDISWYAANPELLRSAASLSFYSTVGLPLPFGSKRAVPGIAALQWCPIISMGDNAPIQQAANSIYSYVVHANSRNYKYDATDQMMMIMAGANVFSSIALGLRAYGIMRNFDGLDYYTPQGLITASRFDYDDLLANLSNMWFDLNEIISRVSQIWIPNVMPVIERWYWMNLNVYRDGESAKSQYYCFVPVQFYQLSETAETTGTSLQPVAWAGEVGKLFKWKEYVAKVRGMINALLASQDRGMIFGDILKAYGPDKLYSLTNVTSDYKTFPVYDREVLTQIENATVYGQYPGKIYQTDTGLIQQNWNTYNSKQIVDNMYIGMRNCVLNFHQKEMPTPEQIMVATRLTVLSTQILSKVQGSDGKAIFQICPYAFGTEIISSLWIYCRVYNTTNNTWGTSYYAIPTQFTSVTSIGQENRLFNWVACDWVPWLYQVNAFSEDLFEAQLAGTLVNNTISWAYGDWDNYTILDREELYKMHLAAVYSEYGLPQNIS